MIKISAAVLSLLALMTPHVDPGSAQAKLKDGEAEVIGQRHLKEARSESGETQGASPHPLTSYQAICVATTANDLAVADACHRASTLCVSDNDIPQTAAWVMTAPSIPTPGPDDWTNTGRIACLTERQAQPAIVVTAQQFRRLPIPPSKIAAQPDPAIRPTLINIPTNLLTTRRVTVLPTTVLGQSVRVRATPARYHWEYGDGEKLTTTEPGHRYPYMPTAHTFRQPGTFTVRLTTTFSGEFSVAGGPWQPINGTAAVGSPAATITAQESRTVLVS